MGFHSYQREVIRVKRKTRRKLFNTLRFACVLTSLSGIVIACAADSVTDMKLMAMQIFLGLITFAIGYGYYMAFKYMELYLMERERKMIRYGREN